MKGFKSLFAMFTCSKSRKHQLVGFLVKSALLWLVFSLVSCTFSPSPTPGFSAQTALQDNELRPQTTETLPSLALTPKPSETALAVSTDTPIPTIEPPMIDLESLGRNFFLEDVEDLELIAHEKALDAQQVHTLRETPLLLLPLMEDFNIETALPLELITVEKGFSFEVAETKTFRFMDGYQIRLALLANTFSYQQRILAILVLDLQNPLGEAFQFAELSQDTGHIVSYIATRDTVYPNKIENILIALTELSTKFEIYQGLHQGNEYSYLNLVGLERGELFYDYKDGLDEFGVKVRANGICSVATGLSTLIKVTEAGKVTERRVHATFYKQGPFSPIEKNVDAAVVFRPNPDDNVDFKWSQSLSTNLSIDAFVFPTGLSITDTDEDGISGSSDIGLIYALQFTEQAEYNTNAKLALERFRELRNTDTAIESTDEPGFSVSYYPLEDEAIKTWVDAVYQRDEVENLSLKIEGSVSESDSRPLTAEKVELPFDTIEDIALFGNNIVITIDDCYHHDNVRAIFELLKAHDIKATFFPNTNYLTLDDETKQLWQDIYHSGFDIGYHTTNHYPDYSFNQLINDFEAFTEHMRSLLEDDTFSITFVRAPYGVWTYDWQKWVEQNNLMSVRWNVVIENPITRVEDLIEQNISPIILLHTGYYDVKWLEDNIESLLEIAEENSSLIGSVRQCLPKD